MMGGTTRLPSISDRLADLFPAATRISTQIDSDEVIAKGCALQATLLHAPSSAPLSSTDLDGAATSIDCLSQPIGLLLGSEPTTGRFVTLLDEATPLPARKTMELQVPEGAASIEVVLSLWEGKHSIKVEEPVAKPANGKKAPTAAAGSDDDEDEDEEEEEPVKSLESRAVNRLVDLVLKVDGSKSGKGRHEATTPVKVTVVVGKDGSGSLSGQQGSGEVFKTDF